MTKHLAMINCAGGVGKSEMGDNLFAVRMALAHGKKKAPVIDVEGVNADGTEELLLRGEKFNKVVAALEAAKESTLVIFGASQFESAIEGMDVYGPLNVAAHITPTTPDVKDQRDTMESITQLIDLGVSEDEIRILFNRVQRRDKPEDVFDKLISFAEGEGLTVNTKCVIHECDIYTRLSRYKMNLSELSEVDMDELRDRLALSPKAEAEAIALRMADVKAACRLMPKYNKVYDELVGDLIPRFPSPVSTEIVQSGADI